jgi:hypothetical protein
VAFEPQCGVAGLERRFRFVVVRAFCFSRRSSRWSQGSGTFREIRATFHGLRPRLQIRDIGARPYPLAV